MTNRYSIPSIVGVGAVGRYQRLANEATIDGFDVDDHDRHDVRNSDNATVTRHVEHSGRARCRVIGFSFLIFLLLALFFVEFGPIIQYVRGSADGRDIIGSELFEDKKEIDDEHEDRSTGSVDSPVASDLTISEDLEDSSTYPATWSLGDLERRCPRWSAEFTKKFHQDCAYWLPKLASWEDHLASHSVNQSVVYFCDGGGSRSCHGWGDRIAGMESAFYRAVSNRHRLVLQHPYLSKLFEPCLFTSAESRWNQQKYTRSRTDECYDNTVDCVRWNWIKCPRANLVAMNGHRACVPPKYCAGLHSSNPSFSSISLFGCGMRALFEPTQSLMTSLKFRFRMDTGRTSLMTLTEIQSYVSRFHVIAIHIHPQSDSEPSLNINFTRLLRCAQTVQSHLDGLGTLNKKTVFLLATDVDAYKKAAFETLKNKIIGFDFKPSRIDPEEKIDFTLLAKEVAEWYIVGSADQLVTMGSTPQAVSTFAKSAWLYNLEDLVYLGSTCEARRLAVDGSFAVNHAACHKSDLFSKTLPQPHLEPLLARNLSFPEYFVDEGKVVASEEP